MQHMIVYTTYNWKKIYDRILDGDLALVSRAGDIQKNSNVYMDHDYSTVRG